MTTIGPNILFCAKYWDKMNLLYLEEDYSIIENRANKDEIIYEVKIIGAAADKETKESCLSG